METNLLSSAGALLQNSLNSRSLIAARTLPSGDRGLLIGGRNRSQIPIYSQELLILKSKND